MKLTSASAEGGGASSECATPAAQAHRKSLNHVLQARLAYLALALALAAAYFAAAKLGLSLAFVAPQVSPVWPPTGIALAAVLLAGYRVWPGIALGAFLANVTTRDETLYTAAGIALGNTLEAVVGAWLLQRQGGFRPTLERLKDVFGLVVLAGAVSTALGATIGVASLCLSGIHGWEDFGFLWRVWWLGDAMGALVVAPVLLTAPGLVRMARQSGKAIEALTLLAALALVCLVAFSGRMMRATDYPLEYTVFPFLIWAALRLGLPATAAVTLLASALAISGATHGFGPFTRGPLHDNLVLLQLFLAVAAVTGLVLSAALSERDTAARRQAIHYAVTRALVESPGLVEAIPRVLRAICEHLNWDVGGLWVVDKSSATLSCEAFWRSPARNVADFETATQHRTFARGVGLPGRVWSSGQPAWIADVTADGNFPRASAAARAGLRGAFGFPIVRNGEVWGVLEFFSRQIQLPDDDLLHTLGAIGSQIGLFLDRRQAEEELRDRESRFRALIERSWDAIAVLAPDAAITYSSLACWRVLGYTPDEMQGMNALGLAHPDDRAQIEQAFAALLAHPGGTLTVDSRARHKDGSWRWLETTGTNLLNDSAVGGIVCNIRDITERRQAAEALQEADRRKDEFLAMLAHELRNPLAPILNAIQVLRLVGGDEPIVRQQYEMIARQVQQMKRLLDDLLDVARITRGQVPLRKEPADLGTILAQAIETSRPMLECKKHALAVELPSGAVRLDADPTRLAQVFTNLLNNAAKYTEPGGQIGLTVEPDRDSVRVRITDTGIGMTPEMLASAFDLFVQADRSLDRAQGGLGIGLTLVKRLVEMHGGGVEAHSDGPGRGSEFIIRLPMSPDQAPAGRAEHQVAAPSESAGTRRILVVEDNVDAAQSLALLLQLQGHQVRVAPSGPTALQLVAAVIPDVVLLDIGLPGMDGYEVARRLRQAPELAGVLLVALTGYGQEEDRRRAREAGFDHHLVKPVDPQALFQVLAGTVAVASGSG